MQAGEWYRSTYDLYVSNAILYPHESNYRSSAFLSKKLLLAAREASQNSKHTIWIGDPEAVADWGYAPEYTQAMYDILTLKDPGDFIISTGHPAKVSDFAKGMAIKTTQLIKSLMKNGINAGINDEIDLMTIKLRLNEHIGHIEEAVLLTEL
jgi:GDP-D-mannose dehydratase